MTQQWGSKFVTRTKDGREPILCGGRPLAEVVTERRASLTKRALARIRAELPIYGNLPEEQLRTDITEAIRRSLDLFLAQLTHGEQMQGRALADLGGSAALRADEGVALESLFQAYIVGTTEIIEALADETSPEEAESAQALGHMALSFLGAALPAIAAGYAEARIISLGKQDAAHQSMIDHLLRGQPAAATAGSLPRFEQYALVRLAIGPHPDELDMDTNTSIATRRKLRRVNGLIDETYGESAVRDVRGDGGVVLIGYALEEPQPNLDGLVPQLADRAEAEMTGVVVHTSASGVREANELAIEIVEMFTMLDMEPKLWRLEDVLLEYQLTRPGPARRQLSARLATVMSSTVLAETLETYLSVGQSRREAARLLHVHPNTIDYRLRKVAELTPWNPASAEGARHLAAALVAHRAECRGGRG